MESHSHQNKPSVGKRLARILLVLFLLICILAAVGWYTFKTDHPFIIDKIEETAKEKWGIAVELEGYNLEWTSFLSRLELQVQDLQLATIDKNLPPLLKINQVTSELDLWDLKSKDFHSTNIKLDSIWIHIYNDSTEVNNLPALSHNANSEKSKEKSLDELKTKIKGFPSAEINYLDFHNEKVALGTWQKFQLSQVEVQSEILQNGDVATHLLSECHFDGLVFNEAAGGYLMDTPGKLDVNVNFLDAGKRIAIKNTALIVDESTYELEVDLNTADDKEFELVIKNAGVTMDKVMPLLSKKINYTLRNIEVDQPIQARFSMAKKMSSNTPAVIKVDFASKDSRLVIHEGNMTSATFAGQFSNDCDNDGIATPSKGCLTIQQVEGDLLGLIPVKLKGEITNLKRPRVNVLGELDIDMVRLNPLLAAQKKLTFKDGNATFAFHFSGGLKELLDSPFDNLDNQLDGKASFDNIRLEQTDENNPWPSLSGRMHFTKELSSLDDIFLNWMGSNIHISGQVGNLPEYLLYHTHALNSDLKIRFDVIDLSQKQKPSGVTPSTENKLTAEKFETLFQTIATNVNGKIDIQADSVVFDDKYLTDYSSSFQLWTPRRTEFIDSSMIKINRMTAKFMGHTDLTLDMGLSRDTITDLWLDLKVPQIAQTTNTFLPDNMKIKDGNGSIALFADVPLRSLFNKEQLFSDIEFEGLIDLDGLELELDEAEPTVKKIHGPINLNNDQISFDSIQFDYLDSPFVFSGKVDDYFFLKDGNPNKAKMDLKLRGDHFDVQNLAGQKVSTTPAQMFRSLDTIFQLAIGNVDLLIDSIITKDDVINPFLLQASLIPSEQNPMQHQLVVDSLNFGFGPENNVVGNALIANPDHPTIDAHFLAQLNFDQFERILSSEFLEFNKGHFRMDLDYHSSLLDSINTENYFLNAKLDGAIQIVDAEIFYNYRHFEFADINADLKFDQKALSIQNLDMLVNGNRFISSGKSEDFFPFFILPNRKAHIELDVASPYFDLGSFTTPHEIEQKKEALPFITADSTESVLSNTGNILDDLLQKGSLEMSTDIKVLALEKFKLNDILGTISLQPDSVHLHNLTMDFAKGNIALDGVLSGVVLHNPIVELDVKIEENDMPEMLRQFENFGLDNFGSQNLKGRASANVQFKADIDSKYSIKPESMTGNVHLRLIEGELIKVKALEDLSGFLFRNRKLDHIQFDTLDALVKVRGNDMYLGKTGLHSSSFDFEVEGIYNLTSFDSTQVLLTIPFSNLYRRHITLQAMRNGHSRRKGLPILIEGRPNKKRLRFRLKIFNSKKRKESYRLPE